MAYLNFAEAATAPVGSMSALLRPARSQETARFSALEWSVIALAERDGLSTLQNPGRIAVALGGLFTKRPNPKLADPKLEALRHMAVLIWRGVVREDDAAPRPFLQAGFTQEHFELLTSSIVTARAKRRF